ncbi:MAG: hypothetical protein CMM93_01230, partial [Rickettsiales bacterium]|nr:hypothetical protein [Rickettsiales bacterium]
MNKFWKLCEKGDLEAIKLFDFQNLDIDRAFQYACENGYLEVVKLLLSLNSLDEKFKKININFNADYAFRIACSNGHLGIVKLLLSLNSSDCEFPLYEGTEININFDDDAAFRYACYNVHSEVVEFLIPLLNQNKYEFYFHKEGEYYIVKPLNFKYGECENIESVKFDDFKIYYSCDEYINECIEAYK